mmetsp:Transcript_39459/g.63586  ORF Transcript_39459/g.63586 Transcript_39459/m.63586 type:complete len:245 (-) Transcript_39459:4-738(-)
MFGIAALKMAKGRYGVRTACVYYENRARPRPHSTKVRASHDLYDAASRLEIVPHNAVPCFKVVFWVVGFEGRVHPSYSTAHFPTCHNVFRRQQSERRIEILDEGHTLTQLRRDAANRAGAAARGVVHGIINDLVHSRGLHGIHVDAYGKVKTVRRRQPKQGQCPLFALALDHSFEDFKVVVAKKVAKRLYRLHQRGRERCAFHQLAQFGLPAVVYAHGTVGLRHRDPLLLSFAHVTVRPTESST